MWDLTVPGNNDHDFYVLPSQDINHLVYNAGQVAAPVLVHNCGNGLKYVTYTKTNPITGEVYTGRTMGYGSDSAIVATRDAGHHMGSSFGPAVVDKSIYATMSYAGRHGDLAYQAIRGRKQSLIDYFGGVQSAGGISVAPKECLGLERDAVWAPEHIESRIADSYAGRPNIYVESLKPKL